MGRRPESEAQEATVTVQATDNMDLHYTKVATAAIERKRTEIVKEE